MRIKPSIPLTFLFLLFAGTVINGKDVSRQDLFELPASLLVYDLLADMKEQVSMVQSVKFLKYLQPPHGEGNEGQTPKSVWTLIVSRIMTVEESISESLPGTIVMASVRTSDEQHYVLSFLVSKDQDGQMKAIASWGPQPNLRRFVPWQVQHLVTD